MYIKMDIGNNNKNVNLFQNSEEDEDKYGTKKVIC
jgi:hypothetical protein